MKRTNKNLNRAMKVTMLSFLTMTQVMTIASVYAVDKDLEVSISAHQQNSQIMNVSIIDQLVKRVSLYKGKEKLKTKEVSQDLYFDVFQNGDYLIVGEDENGNTIAEERVNVNTFDEMSVSENIKNQELSIISRYPYTNEILVNGNKITNPGVVSDGNGYRIRSYRRWI